MYTLLYLKWITNKDLLYSTWDSVQCYVAAWIGGAVWGRMNTCINMAKFLYCEPQSITTLLTLYSPVQKKRSLKKKAIKDYYFLCSIPLVGQIRWGQRINNKFINVKVVIGELNKNIIWWSNESESCSREIENNICSEQLLHEFEGPSVKILPVATRHDHMTLG